METFEDEVVAWIQSEPMTDGYMEISAYADNIVMVRLEGTEFHLSDNWPATQWHMFLQLFNGEVHLTKDDSRLGFEAPIVVDFIAGYDWKDIRLMNRFYACLLITKQKFFLDSVDSLRSKIAKNMLHYAQNPFIQLPKENAYCLQQQNNALFATMSMKNKLLQQEQIQMLLCAGMCETWNAIFIQQGIFPNRDNEQWNSIVAQFFYLAHFHIRKQHEVRWYAALLGCTPDALSAKLKSIYGKNASMLLNEMLITEAKILLQKEEYTIQQVAETLCFSDQSAFGKFFRRNCHMSPMQYRLQARMTKNEIEYKEETSD